MVAQLSNTLTGLHKLYNFTRGSGVSAPQIGYLSRISVVEYDGIRHVLINPEIIEHSPDKILIREGCLSFFDYRGNVARFQSVGVKALDEKGISWTINASGNFAMLLQHEIDHLDGILFVDRLPGKDDDLYLIADMPIIP